MANLKKTNATKTQAQQLEEFKGRFSRFLNPEERRAKVRLVPPARRIAQDRLEALESLRVGILTCLTAYEKSQATLVDEVRRGIPIESGKLTAALGKNARGDEVVVISGLEAPIHCAAGKVS